MTLVETAPPAPAPAGPRRARRRALQALSAAVTVAVLGGVASVAVAVRPSEVSRRWATPDAVLDPAEAAAYRAFAAVDQQRPVILSYRDVRERDDPADTSTVNPTDFARHLAMLATAGFTTIGADDLVAYLDGRPLPPRSVLITFDRGTKGVWQYADPLLERYGFRASAFVLTGSVGTHQPYYLNWPELERMRDSGRWSIESHSHAGQDRVRVAADPGHLDLFVLNRAWRPGEDRLETFDEWEARVRADLERSVATLTGRGFPRPRLFSYPFTSVVSNSNDDRIPARLEELAATLFAGALVSDAAAGAVRPREVALRNLPRLEVRSTTTAAALFERLTTHHRLELADARRPLDRPDRWRSREGAPGAEARFEAGGLRLDSPPGRQAWLGFAPDETGHWRNYRAAVTVSGLSTGERGGRGALEVLSGSDMALRVTVTGGWARVERVRTATTRLAEATVPLATEHRIEVLVRPDRTVVRVDGALLWYGGPPHPELGEVTGGVALSARPDPGLPLPEFRDLTVAPVR